MNEVCDHLAWIIMLEKEIENLEARYFKLSICNHISFKSDRCELEMLLDYLTWYLRTDQYLQEVQKGFTAIMTAIQESVEDVRNLQKQLSTGLTLAARATLTVSQGSVDKGQEFPHSPEISGLDWPQIRYWIVQYQMGIWHKPWSFPDKYMKVSYTCNHLRRITIGQMRPHICQDKMIGLGELPAFGDHDQVAAAELEIHKNK
jgi:hypothetical protein